MNAHVKAQFKHLVFALAEESTLQVISVSPEEYFMDHLEKLKTYFNIVILQSGFYIILNKYICFSSTYCLNFLRKGSNLPIAPSIIEKEHYRSICSATMLQSQPLY